MPLGYEVQPEGRSAAALRLARGKHGLVATGPAAALGLLLPHDTTVTTKAPDGRPLEVKLSFRLGTWLVAHTLIISDAVAPLALYAYQVGAERLGAALDLILPQLSLTEPVSPSVLRKAITSKAEALRRSHPKVLTVTFACLLLVGGDDDDDELQNMSPSVATPPLVPSFMAHATFSDYMLADGTAPVLFELDSVWQPRFFPSQRVAKCGFDASWAQLLLTFPSDESKIINACSSEGKNEQYALIANTLLPTAEPLAAFAATESAARLGFARTVKRASSSAGALNVGVHEILTALPHYPIFLQAVGQDVSAAAALGLATELVRAALLQPTAPVTLTTLESASKVFLYLAPRLGAMHSANAPAADRCAFLMEELAQRRKHEGAARGGISGGEGASSTPGTSSTTGAGGGGYAAIHVAKLCDILADPEFIALCGEVTTNLDAQLAPAVSIELILASRAKGSAILHHALRGQVNAVRELPVVARVATELRHHGPQWAADKLADCLLPPEDETMPRVIPSPLPELWDAMCKAAWGELNFENICYTILAECGGHEGHVHIPNGQQFASIDRLRRCERALVPFLALFGFEAGGDRGLDTVLATVYAYYDDATAVPSAARMAFIRSVLCGVYREAAARDAALLAQRDPSVQMPSKFAIVNSGAVARLQRARQDTPATNTMARTMATLLNPIQAKQLGLARKLVPDGMRALVGDGGLAALTKSVTELGAEQPPDGDKRPRPEPQSAAEKAAGPGALPHVQERAAAALAAADRQRGRRRRACRCRAQWQHAGRRHGAGWRRRGAGAGAGGHRGW